MKAKEPRAARANETKKIHQVFRPKLIQIRYVYLNTCFGYRSYIYMNNGFPEQHRQLFEMLLQSHFTSSLPLTICHPRQIY